ncbi:hypothetical protein GCM10022270_23610 [Terriglobus aquaticus]
MQLTSYSDLSANLNRAAALCASLEAERQRLFAILSNRSHTRREAAAYGRVRANLDQLNAVFCWDVDFNEMPTA